MKEILPRVDGIVSGGVCNPRTMLITGSQSRAVTVVYVHGRKHVFQFISVQVQPGSEEIQEKEFFKVMDKR